MDVCPTVPGQLDPLGPEYSLQDVEHARDQEPLPEVGSVKDQRNVPRGEEVVCPVEDLEEPARAHTGQSKDKDDEEYEKEDVPSEPRCAPHPAHGGLPVEEVLPHGEAILCFGEQSYMRSGRHYLK